MALVLAFMRNQSRRENRATEPRKPKQQSQQEMLRVLDGL